MNLKEYREKVVAILVGTSENRDLEAIEQQIRDLNVQEISNDVYGFEKVNSEIVYAIFDPSNTYVNYERSYQESTYC